VARRFGRFAFPDEVVPWLSPLETVIASKAARPLSPEGIALQDVIELRIESSNGWQAAPYELTLSVIVKPGTLPTFPDDELPNLPSTLEQWLHPDDPSRPVPTSSQIATRLHQTADPAESYFCWAALAEAWADRCRPAPSNPPEVMDAVTSLTAEIVSADEYVLTRYRRSEQLDLDHLSEPAPH
jgi:hypothetical protein